MAAFVKNLNCVNGKYKYRKSIPKHLRPFIEGNITEYVRWLGVGPTHSPAFVEAYGQAVAECDALIAAAKLALATPSLRIEDNNDSLATTSFNDTLTSDLVDYVLQNERYEAAQEAQSTRFDTSSQKLFLHIREQLKNTEAEVGSDSPYRQSHKRMENYSILKERYLRAYRLGSIPLAIYTEAAELLESYNVDRPYDCDLFVEFTQRYIASRIETLSLLQEREDGNFSKDIVQPTLPVSLQPSAPVTLPSELARPTATIEQRAPFEVTAINKPLSRSPVSTNTNEITLREMAERKLDMSKNGGPTREATQTALNLFESVYGNPQFDSITRRQVADWIYLLLQKPKHVKAQDKSLPLRDLVAKYSGREDVERLSGKSINGHVGHLSSIWEWSRKRGLIDRALDNPFSDQRVEERMVQPDEGFTPLQLQAIFDTPVFASGERPTRGRGHASFWIPLLLLTYGARPEEICQLLVSDIVQDEDSKSWKIKITDEGEHPAKGPRHLKADGNVSVRRSLPVSERLISLGFLDYVDYLKTSNEIALFPKLTTKGKRGYLYESFATWWGEYLREHRAIPDKGNKPLRSFRDAWTTAAVRSNVSEEEREWIQGHYIGKGKTSNRLYGIRDYGSKIDEIHYKGLNLDRVKKWAPTR